MDTNPTTPNVDAPAVAPEPASTPAPAPAPAPTPEITPESAAAYFGTTPEAINKFKTFYENNGGFDKVFTRARYNIGQGITGPDPDAQPQPQPAVQLPQPNPLNDYPPQSQPLAGGFTTEEFMTQQYFESLSHRDEYASVAQEIRSGEVLKEMSKFGIRPIVNGQFNNKQITDFLDMYAKTKPAPTPATPVTTTPTVEYVQTGDTITNMDEAMRVLAQDQQLRAEGKQGHPMAEQANKFFDETLNKRQNVGKREHYTIDPNAKKK